MKAFSLGAVQLAKRGMVSGRSQSRSRATSDFR